jgi:hypothetical protein
MLLRRSCARKITLISVLAGALFSSAVFAASNHMFRAAYVLFGQSESGDTVPMARVIIDGVNVECPILQPVETTHSDGIPIPAVQMQARVNPDPVNFPITVCESLYPTDTKMSVAGSTFDLPKVKTKVDDLAIFGDSGCEPSFQLCDKPSASWPFGILASTAVRRHPKPDVILHMGDYNYRGTPSSIKIEGMPHKVSVYDAGDNAIQGHCQSPGGYYGQNSPGSQSPDNWDDWNADFFSPAKPLLSSSPWIFTRGNHELCSRAGTGWFYMLDSNSKLLGESANQLHCPKAGNSQPMVLSLPYLVNLGSLNVVVLDSANACDSGLLHTDSYINQFDLIKSFIADADADADNEQQTWLQTHRPLWGVDTLDAVGTCGSQSSDKYCFVNKTLQYANAQSPLSAKLDLVVSGHMHRFQVVNFSKEQPQQLIVGQSGVKLAQTPLKRPMTLTIDGHKAAVMGMSEFGYMRIVVKKHSWSGELLGAGQAPLATFDSTNSPIFKLN